MDEINSDDERQADRIIKKLKSTDRDKMEQAIMMAGFISKNTVHEMLFGDEYDEIMKFIRDTK